MEIIENNLDNQWNWYSISSHNKNITIDMIKKNLNKSKKLPEGLPEGLPEESPDGLPEELPEGLP